MVTDSQERTGFAYLNGELVDLAGFFAPPEFYDKWLDGELDLSEPAALASEGLGATGARGIDQQCGTGNVMPGWVREAFMERVFGTSDTPSTPTVRPDTQQ